MIGSRAWRALMRRNFIYRWRHWLATLLEVALPIAFVGILLAIKNAVEGTSSFAPQVIEAFYPANNVTYTPLSFGDYLTALQAQRFCIPTPPGSPGVDGFTFGGTGGSGSSPTTTNNGFSITGIANQGYNWQVPFVKCDSRQCTKNDTSAMEFCEFGAMGVAPSAEDDEGGLERAKDFVKWLYERYPVLFNANNELPITFPLVQNFTSPTAINQYVQGPSYGNSENPKLVMAIVFEGNDPTQYVYSLRQNTTNFNSPEDESRPTARTTPPTNTMFASYAKSDFEVCLDDQGGPDQGPLSNSCTGQYLYNGILTFTRLVDDYILDRTGAAARGYGVSQSGVQFVQFPTPKYTQNGFYATIQVYGPLLVTLGMLYPVASMISYIVREKELRQKELMKMMSVTESDIGFAWFVNFFIFGLITASATAGVSTSLYENSAPLYLWIFWALTFLAIIVFAMAISTLTSIATRGVLIGLLVFFVGVFLTLAVSFETGSAGIIALISLHPVAAFSYGLQEIGRLEDLGIGLQPSSVGTSDTPSGYTFNQTITSLIFDSVLWGVVTFYLNRVLKPAYGQALPWYFPFTRSFWCPGQAHAPSSDDSSKEQTYEGIPFEPVGNNLLRQKAEGKSIEIHKLNKTFGDKAAVDGLSLSMYNGQITALLGHNGAGKTTTIGMLTGAIQPTEGYATVSGKDIRTQLQQIRQDIGICLQHDCLFPALTVREHIQFFARIKGVYATMSHEDAEAQVDAAIHDVALAEKTTTLSKNLSGGMKRKLSVAIAFCGGSKVVLLDEPTSGMDPFSRRFTWNVIRNYRQDRCIILTTHFMDEADILGDRIAIMSEGRLRCAGSSLFLKKVYGVGYQLTIEKLKAIDASHDEDAEQEEEGTLTANDERIKRIVKEAVPEASLLSNVGSELSYQLPVGAAPKFGPMFEQLDAEIDRKTVSSYGVSMTTLDEVFLLVARGESHEKREEYASASLRPGDLSKAAVVEEANKSVRSRMDLENERLFLTHLGALFKKRAANFKRDKKAWVCTTILPSLFVLIGFIIFKFASPSRDLQPVTLSLDEYNAKITTGTRNPIPFNSPGEEFTCQPGICAYQQPKTQIPDLDETYFFCGDNGRLLAAPNCSISNSAFVASRFINDGASPEPASVEYVTEGSFSLAETSRLYAASQYGAIWFSHEQNSSMSNSNVSYSEAVIQQCSGYPGNYSSAEACARLGGVGYVIQYNYTALHVSPMYQVLADEALAREALNNDDISIQLTIDPLPITQSEASLGAAQDATTAWFLVVLSFPFIAGAFATFVVTERQSKAKHLQTVAGVEPSSYWIATYLWDTLNYQIPLWVTVILMFAFDIEVLTTTKQGVLSGVIVTLFLYGPASAAFTYCVSFAFTSAALCNIVVIITGFLIALGGPLAAFILILIGNDPANPQQNLIDAANILTWILRFFPAFNLGKGLFNAINISAFTLLEGTEVSAWSEPVLLYEVIFLAWESVVYLWLAILLDKWSTNPRAVAIWRKFTGCLRCACLFGRGKNSPNEAVLSLPDDDDVLMEQDRVLTGGANNDLIVVSQLTKQYDDGKLAVNNLSFGIPPGECFGLLGINGAGKTTTMSILTAEFPPTSGDATLAGYSVVKQPEKSRRRTGYCPQFDAHFANMTGREHVELYAAIKGVPRDLVKEAAAAKLREVGLSDFDCDRVTSGYSGGMKRRLSLACAMIGQPQVVFLDEASTGVDPVARRDIWKLISDMVSGGNLPLEERTSVILTTHSMEECEALCPRIAIMANGRLRCLGSAQHLKNKFGRGFQVEMKVSLVSHDDEDYQQNALALARSKLGQPADAEASTAETIPEEMFFTLDEVTKALSELTGDEYLSSMINGENPWGGYAVWKDATSPVGAPLDEVAAFAATELRMRRLDDFVKSKYPNSVLRERQDSKARYEVSSDGVRIASIFNSIESNKDALELADYGVSQTSLEQVFNMHAAEAERVKNGEFIPDAERVTGATPQDDAFETIDV